MLLACGRIGFDPEQLGGDVDAAPPPDGVVAGLVARYDFDTDVTSDSALGRSALCQDGCPALDGNGRIGSALSMDGGISHLEVMDDGSFNMPDGFTVAGWVRHRAIPGRTCLFTKPSTGSSNSWALCTDSDRRPFFFSCEGCDFLSAPDPVQLDTWTHLAGSYDGGLKKFYVDGVLVAEIAGMATFTMESLIIGGDIDGGFGFATDGLIDELRVYDRALDPGEIAILAAP